MSKTGNSLAGIVSQVGTADVTAIRQFLFSNPSQPLVATGSGGCESSGDFLALLYGARGGMAQAVTPYTFNSFSDNALRTAKIVLISKGGHNNDIIAATRRALEVNPAGTASINFSDSDRNEALKLFRKAGAPNAFVPSVHGTHDGFVSVGTSIAYFALLTKVFQPGVDLGKYMEAPEKPFTFCLNDGTTLAPSEFGKIRSYVLLHGSWGRPVASNLEGKMVESGLAPAIVCDYRNHCHGRFIWESNHLDETAVVMFISPRERDIAERTRKYLPASTKLVLIETAEDAPEASLDLLVRATEFFRAACDATGVNPVSPSNPGRIDKRVPISIPFVAEMRKTPGWEEVFIANCKDYKFMKSKLARFKIANISEKEISLIKPDGKTQVKMTWVKFYQQYHGNLNELIIKFIEKGKNVCKLSDGKRLSLQPWADAMMGAALTMQIICGDDPTVTTRAEQIAKNAVKELPEYLNRAKAIFPDMQFDAVPEE